MVHKRGYGMSGYYHYAAHGIKAVEARAVTPAVAPAEADAAPAAPTAVAAIGSPARAANGAARRCAFARKQTDDTIVNRNKNTGEPAAGQTAAGCKNRNGLTYMTYHVVEYETDTIHHFHSSFHIILEVVHFYGYNMKGLDFVLHA